MIGQAGGVRSIARLLGVLGHLLLMVDLVGTSGYSGIGSLHVPNSPQPTRSGLGGLPATPPRGLSQSPNPRSPRVGTLAIAQNAEAEAYREDVRHRCRVALRQESSAAEVTIVSEGFTTFNDVRAAAASGKASVLDGERLLERILRSEVHRFPAVPLACRFAEM
jgi:hypothetical protein